MLEAYHCLDEPQLNPNIYPVDNKDNPGRLDAVSHMTPLCSTLQLRVYDAKWD